EATMHPCSSYVFDEGGSRQHRIGQVERSSHLSTNALFRLDGLSAVVTGAGSGLGREIALAFADAGAAVLAVDIDGDAAAATAADAPSSLGAAAVDVRDARAVAEVVSTLERVDVLVNSAGVGGWGPTESYPDD